MPTHGVPSERPSGGSMTLRPRECTVLGCHGFSNNDYSIGSCADRPSGANRDDLTEIVFALHQLFIFIYGAFFDGQFRG